MNMPFTRDEFLAVFITYNSDFTFVPIITYLAGLSAVALLFLSKAWRNQAIFALLGSFWIWNGAIYHLIYFRPLNPAATLFGILFILQGGLLLSLVFRKSAVEFGVSSSGAGALGAVLILYALVIYPLLGFSLGHIYPAAPVFGMAPCPTTIFTLGMLLHVRTRLPWRYLLIPFLWCLVGLSAALNLQIWEDLGLIVAGLLSVPLIVLRNRRISTT